MKTLVPWLTVFVALVVPRSAGADLRVVEVVASAADVRASAVVGDAVWLGTTGGLVRIGADHRTTRVTSLDGLPEQRIRAVAALADGTLLLGTDHGLLAWRDGLLLRTMPAAAVVALTTDGGGDAYAATADRKLWRVTAARTLEPLVVPLRGTPYALAFVAGRLWIGTSRGLFGWDGATAAPVRGRLPDDAVMALAADGDELLVGTSGGIARVRGGRVVRRSVVRSFPIADVRSIVAEPGGATLVGTWGGGAWRVDARGVATALPGVPQDGRVQTIARFDGRVVVGLANGAVVDGVALELGDLASNDVAALARQGDTLWIGTFEHGLVARTASGVTRTWTEGTGLLDNRVNALAVQGDAVWAALERGVCRWSAERLSCWRAGAGPAIGHATSLLVAGHEVFVGSSGGLARWDGTRWAQVPLPFDRITALARRGDGGLWVGSAEGLARLAAGTLAVEEIRTAGAGTLHDDWVTLLSMGSDGGGDGGDALWVGTYSSGLARIDADGTLHVLEAGAWLNPAAVAAVGSMRLFGGLDEGVLVMAPGGTRPSRLRTGLPSRDVTAIVAAPNGGAWVATRAGLARLAPR